MAAWPGLLGMGPVFSLKFSGRPRAARPVQGSSSLPFLSLTPLPSFTSHWTDVHQPD